MIADVRPFTDWFIALLEAGTSKSVGDHRIPPLGDPLDPYCIVYAIPGGGFDGPALTSPDADARLIHQVTSAGKTRAQAQWMADLVRRTVLSRTASGAFQVQLAAPLGWSIPDRRPVGGPGGIDPEGKDPHLVYSGSDRFEICITPA